MATKSLKLELIRRVLAMEEEELNKMLLMFEDLEEGNNMNMQERVAENYGTKVNSNSTGIVDDNMQSEWNKLSDAQRQGINDARASLRKNGGTVHEEVMKDIRSRYGL